MKWGEETQQFNVGVLLSGWFQGAHALSKCVLLQEKCRILAKISSGSTKQLLSRILTSRIMKSEMAKEGFKLRNELAELSMKELQVGT